MSNIKDFFEKVQSDKAMQEALAQARMEAIIAVAGKYGFAITESDFKEMSENISAEELSAVTGGVTAWDGVGWNPAAKPPMTREEAMENGLLGPDGKLLPMEKRLLTMKDIMAKML